MSALLHLLHPPAITPPKGRIVRTGVLPIPAQTELSTPTDTRCDEVYAILKLHGAPMDTFTMTARMGMKSTDYMRRILRVLVDEGRATVRRVNRVMMYSAVV